MPFIHITSLPFEEPPDLAAVVEGVTLDVAGQTGIASEHVTATWSYLEPGHYAVAGCAARCQPRHSHPVLVEILAPDFNSPEQIETMLRCVADSIARRTALPVDNIFINYRQARPGMVFDAGDIVRW